MSKTHWKKLTNPDYLGAYALVPGEDLIATIKTVKREIVTGPEGKKEECSVAYFKESSIKPMILNATNSKTISNLYNSPYIEDWEDKKIQIYADNRIRLGRDYVEGLRIRKFIPKEIKVDANGEVKCENCGQAIMPFENLTALQLASYTQKKYGKALCSECAKKSNEIGRAEDVLG